MRHKITISNEAWEVLKQKKRNLSVTEGETADFLIESFSPSTPSEIVRQKEQRREAWRDYLEKNPEIENTPKQWKTWQRAYNAGWVGFQIRKQRFHVLDFVPWFKEEVCR